MCVPLSHDIARPWTSSHSLASASLCFHPHLQSLSITPIRSLLCIASPKQLMRIQAKRNCSSSTLGFAAQLFNWHSLAYTKGDILCISNPKSRVPLDNDTKAHGPLHFPNIQRPYETMPPRQFWQSLALQINPHAYGYRCSFHLGVF